MSGYQQSCSTCVSIDHNDQMITHETKPEIADHLDVNSLPATRYKRFVIITFLLFVFFLESSSTALKV